MEEKDLTVVSRIETEIDKINNKQANVFFFVIDTKGTPSGSLEYIYRLASIVKEDGYNVTMLYQIDEKSEEEFIGVGEWLGEKFASLPHENITSEDVKVSPSDILFIPEIFSNVMLQTKELPCKRIAIMQNYDYILDQTPMSAQWGDFRIMEAITNTDLNGQLLKEIFPYVKTTTIEPYIGELFGETEEPKKMIINIVCRDQMDINRIIKPFYWKYPQYKWVSFRDLRGFPKENFAKLLREGIATIWVDDTTSFGYSALEALKSGSIVIAKTTSLTQKWMEGEDGLNLRNNCIWFDTFHEVHKMIASVVRSWVTDNVPSTLHDEAEKTLEMYSYENTKEKMLAFVNGVFDSRKREMEELITAIKSSK